MTRIVVTVTLSVDYTSATAISRKERETSISDLLKMLFHDARVKFVGGDALRNVEVQDIRFKTKLRLK